jgi:hypothetical protein
VGNLVKAYELPQGLVLYTIYGIILPKGDVAVQVESVNH